MRSGPTPAFGPAPVRWSDARLHGGDYFRLAKPEWREGDDLRVFVRSRRARGPLAFGNGF